MDIQSNGQRHRALFAVAISSVVISIISVGCDPLPACGDGSEPDGLKCETSVDAGSDAAGVSCEPDRGLSKAPAECGIFVSYSRGDDAGAGTPEQPLRTLGAAIAMAKGRPIYACAEEFPATKTIEIPSGTVIFGGYDCNNGWIDIASEIDEPSDMDAQADPRLTRISAQKEGFIPVRLQSGNGKTRLRAFAISARDGAAPSGSSIALLVEGGYATLQKAVIRAGKGAEGAPGEDMAGAGTSGADGAPGGDACGGGLSVPGGAGAALQCDGIVVNGGTGGTGGTTEGSKGERGKPLDQVSGDGGGGEFALPCKKGVDGKMGADGVEGAHATVGGTIGMDGYTGVFGADGKPGAPGQGGGGGGGSKGGVGPGKCPVFAGGASGGGGGSGGCGGLGGKGGGPGGSSIAIVSLGNDAGSRLFIETVQLWVSQWALGGDGGLGQSGGIGGTGAAGGQLPMGATSLYAGCAGGNGGQGGTGGKGGRGLHGYSIGIAHQGEIPRTINVSFDPDQVVDGQKSRPFN